MSSTWTVILAQAAKPQIGSWNSPFFWAGLSLVGVLLVGILVLVMVSHYRKQLEAGRKGRPEGPDAGDLLSHFRSLYDRGQLSREEFEQIRAKLGAKLRQELQVPGKTVSPTPPAGPDAPGKDAPKLPDPPQGPQAP